MIYINTITINNELAYEIKFAPHYYVTKNGDIYSTFVKGGQGRTDINTPHLLSYGKDKDGYYRVVLCINGKRKYVKVHTVVVEQFIGHVNSPNVVNHIDGIKTNNHVDNLEIISVQENTQHAHRLGLTNREEPVVVINNHKVYSFSSLCECMDTFPNLSRNYLEKIRKHSQSFQMMWFEKENVQSRYSRIIVYYNGEIYKVFNDMKSVDKYFNVSRGSTSAIIKAQQGNNLKRHGRNAKSYYVFFPNVSTIENTK